MKDYPGYGTHRFPGRSKPMRTVNSRSRSSPAGASWAPGPPGPTGWEPGSKTSRGCTRGGSRSSLRYPAQIMPANFNTLIEIDPRPGEESVTVDIGLDRGRTLKGKLVGPDGEPVAGALMLGAEDDVYAEMVRATASHGRVRGARAREPSGSAGCSSITRRSTSPGPMWSSPMRRAP